MIPGLIIGDFNVTTWTELSNDWTQERGIWDLACPTEVSYDTGSTIDKILFYLLSWILRGISDEVMILAGVLPAYEGAEEAGDHPLELVPEDAVDDEVDGAVDCH